ncbi:Glu-tRNA(Gln) amidotransferase subunit GatD [Candidatus Pacearchaeota archaeon]|nr:Glu-tRNA(Gln) amidotransferase subunit GatD [Candidatus Pacearchaeota archaeon]
MVEIHAKPGDSVRIRLAKREIDGILLESPDSSVVLLKVESGYNIGIAKENVLALRILKKYIEPVLPSLPLPSQNLPAIGLVITGGTIASKLDAKTGGVKPLTSVQEFTRFYPELFQLARVKAIENPFMILSESMSSEHWITIAQCVKKLLDDPEIQGVIVMHGTDTLHYTGAALSFFLKNLNKPVVLTYAQRSIDRASSDARLNLQCAVQMALSECAEVVLVGHANLDDEYCQALRATKVRKMHSSRRDAFQPINTDALAHVWPDKITFYGTYRKRHSGMCELDDAFSDTTALVKFYPGQHPDILDFYALKYKGIVLEMTGLGHVAASDSAQNWIPSLKKHIKNGLIVCGAAQTLYGRLDPLVYSNGRDLAETGIIFLEDMLPETALVKLGWVLGHYGWKKHVREKMLSNIAGEFGERLVA